MLQPGEFVFATIPGQQPIPKIPVIASIQESEGLTIVVSKQLAQEQNMHYQFVCSWITLQVHSSLDAVGLTAAFSGELSKNGISCNVISGYYHDHIFVGVNDTEHALQVLQKLADKNE